MNKYHSLLSSLALGVGLTLGISTPAIAYPFKNHRVRQPRVIIVHPSRSSRVNYRDRYYRNSSRYYRDYDRDYRGRDYYDDDCRDRRRGRGRRRNIIITNPPVYRNNLPYPNYIQIRTVR